MFTALMDRFFGNMHAKSVRERVGNGDNDEKDGERGQKPIAARAIHGVRERKREIRARDYFDDDAEGEILAGDEGEEERRRYEKWDECEEEYGSEDGPAEGILEYHGEDYSTTGAFV